jgi:HD-GYP domain-containing protein (c-di-GMP phosphodiesterase class II)
VLARIGGDEFAFLMPHVGLAEAYERIGRIRELFDSYNASLKDKTKVVNLSIGCSTKEHADTNIADVEKVADANMSRRKLFDQKSHHNAILTSIMTTLFERSFETEEHAQRIAQLCKTIGVHMGLAHDDIDKLHLLSMLHDIGKVGVSDRILKKPDKLTEEEWREMRKHPEIGYRIAMSSSDFAPVAEYILAHHERWDGTGYPNGMAGETIPLLSRILAVADAYDAMTQDRVYHKAIAQKDALAEIQQNAGTQFDPNVVEVFLRIMEEEGETL